MGGPRPEREGSADDRIRAVHRNAERAARELRGERTDSALELARAFGAIDRGEDAAHLEARVSFLERQVDRLVSRRDEAAGAVQSDLAMMRARIDAALEALAACTDARRRDRKDVEDRTAAQLTEAEERFARHARALQADLEARSAAVHGLLAEIREALSVHMSATFRAAEALLRGPLAQVVDRLPRLVEAADAQPSAVVDVPHRAAPAPSPGELEGN